MTERDYVLARVAVATTTIMDAREQLGEAVQHFISPDDDANGAKRADALEEAEMLIRIAAEAVQNARETMGNLDDDDLAQCELDDDDDDDEGDDQEGE